MSRNARIRAGFVVFTAGLMTVIFLLSSQNSGDSNHLSKGVLDALLGVFHLELTQRQLELSNLVPVICIRSFRDWE